MIARLSVLAAAALLATGAVDPNDPFRAATIVEHPGARIPLDGRVVDADGGSTSLRRIAADRPLLLVPVQHECPNICGVTLAGIASAIDGQSRWRPGRDFAVVAFGIDPREGAAAARDDLRRLAVQRPGARWQPVAVAADAATIGAVTGALGYRYAWSAPLRQYAHVSAAAVLTADGRLSSWLYGIAPAPAQVDAALAQAARGGQGGIMRQLLLLCFHYDPQTGRFTPTITLAMRIAGGLTALGLGGLLLGLARRRRSAA